MEEKLATELLREINRDKKRWFVFSMIELVLLFIITGLFLWYISLPVETTDVNQSADHSSYNQLVGGDINGGTSEGSVQAKSVSQ